MSRQEQTALIGTIPPFNQLSPPELAMAATAMDIAYFQANQYLCKQGEPPEKLYIVIKGLIHELDENDELISFYTAQDAFDALALLEGESKHSYLAHQETYCYTLPKSIFLTLINQNPHFKEAFHQTLTARLNTMIEQRNSKEMSSFMVAKISDAYLQMPLFVDANTSIYNAVQTMTAHKMSAVLVKRGEEIGIFTDTDIRKQVVLKRISVDEPIGDYANYKLISLRQDDFLFNARLAMTKHGVKRLLIRNAQEDIVGLLEQIDLFSYFSNDSRLITVQIERATHIAQLKKAAEPIVEMIQSLNSKGTKIRYIAQLVSELNRRIFQKLYTLLAPPDLLANSCLLVMGSEGREEQVLRTDQDNALILRDGYEYPDLPALTQQFTQILIEMGYPPCPGNIMISNPAWCKPLKAFQNQIFDWTQLPNEESLMNLAIFYDARCVAGDSSLLDAVDEYLFKLLQDNPVFYSHFAKPTLAFETPLNWFENFIVEKSSTGKQLDIKKGGIFPIVQGVRSLALEKRLTMTNTIERIKALQKLEVFDKKFSVELIEAFAFMSWVRLHGDLLRIKAGEKEHNNYINPDNLNKLERDLLKDSLKIVNAFKKFITLHFRLNLVT